MNRSKEKISILAMLILISLIIGCIGNQSISGINGKYVNKDNSALQIELKSDKTFTMTSIDSSIGNYGTYDIEGDTINFKLSVGAMLSGKIQGNTIILNFGGNHTFVKQ